MVNTIWFGWFTKNQKLVSLRAWAAYMNWKNAVRWLARMHNLFTNLRPEKKPNFFSDTNRKIINTIWNPGWFNKNQKNFSICTHTYKSAGHNFHTNARNHSCRQGAIRIMNTHLCQHAEKSLRNLIKSNRSQIVYTIFRLIWNKTDIRLVPNQMENGKYNLILVWFKKIWKIVLCF